MSKRTLILFKDEDRFGIMSLAPAEGEEISVIATCNDKGDSRRRVYGDHVVNREFEHIKQVSINNGWSVVYDGPQNFG